VKQQVSPVVFIGIAAVVLIAAGLFLWRGANNVGAAVSDKPVVPPSVTAEFEKRMGGPAGAGGAGGAPAMHSGQGGGGNAVPPGGMAGYMSSPPGNAPAGNAGYMAPPPR
jgi:hypothetical protein